MLFRSPLGPAGMFVERGGREVLLTKLLLLL